MVPGPLTAPPASIMIGAVTLSTPADGSAGSYDQFGRAKRAAARQRQCAGDSERRFPIVGPGPPTTDCRPLRSDSVSMTRSELASRAASRAASNPATAKRQWARQLSWRVSPTG
jgi:hypothetical protein